MRKNSKSTDQFKKINLKKFQQCKNVQKNKAFIDSLLEKTGVKTINPEGEKFDPNFHEAMFEIPSEDHEPGIIIQVIEHGYVLENRLLRAAKVGVSSKKDEEKTN